MSTTIRRKTRKDKPAGPLFAQWPPPRYRLPSLDVLEAMSRPKSTTLEAATDGGSYPTIGPTPFTTGGIGYRDTLLPKVKHPQKG
jgi:hypothetical protein